MDMLTFSKEREPDPVPSDINKVVGEVVELAQARAAELNVAVEALRFLAGKHSAADLRPRGNSSAVLNIATNAVDACDERPDGKVTIRTEYLPAESIVAACWWKTTARASHPRISTRSSRSSSRTREAAARGWGCR